MTARRIARFAVLGALLLPMAALADVVVLSDGTRFVGVVFHRGKDAIAIRSNGNEWVFAPSEVASVKIEGPGRRLEQRLERTHRAQPEPASDEVAPSGTPHVVVYGTSWCGFCKAAREWFRSHNIPFEDRDIEQDEGARREVAEKCEAAGTRFNGSVPVLDVNGEIIHGFSVPQIEQALKHSS